MRPESPESPERITDLHYFLYIVPLHCAFPLGFKQWRFQAMDMRTGVPSDQTSSWPDQFMLRCTEAIMHATHTEISAHFLWNSSWTVHVRLDWSNHACHTHRTQCTFPLEQFRTVHVRLDSSNHACHALMHAMHTELSAHFLWSPLEQFISNHACHAHRHATHTELSSFGVRLDSSNARTPHAHRTQWWVNSKEPQLS